MQHGSTVLLSTTRDRNAHDKILTRMMPELPFHGNMETVSPRALENLASLKSSDRKAFFGNDWRGISTLVISLLNRSIHVHV